MDGEEGSGKSLFDPVRDALDNIKSGARAGLNGIGKNKGLAKGGIAGGKEKGSAANGLKSAEKSAAGGGLTNGGNNLSSVRQNESSAGGLYSGAGKAANPTGGKGKGKGFLKKGGPMAAIFGLILGVGGLMAGSQALMPFSLLEQFQETFDSIKVVNTKRSNVFFGKQLENMELKNPIYQKYLGFGSNTFKVHTKQKTKLKTQGIYVSDEIDFGTGKKQSIMLFDDGSGKLKVVTAGDTNIDISKIDLSEIDADIDLSKMEIDTDVMDFKAAFNDVSDFRNGYIKGSRTWRGSVGAWFDSVTLRFLDSNDLTRNRFKKFRERVEAEQAGNTKSAAKKVTTDSMEASAEELESKSNDYDIGTETDENGNTNVATDGDGKPVKTNSSEETVTVKTKASKTEIKAKLDEIKNGKLGKASGYVSAAVNIGCTVFDIIGAINLLIVAQETIQIIQVVTGYFEAIDKVKAGDGDDSPINVLAEGLTTPKATTVMKEGSGDDVEEAIADGKENTSAMQSAGISALYSGTAVNTSDASVQNFNIGERFNDILGHLGNSLVSFAACAIAKAAAAVVDAGIEIAAIAGCIASLGIGCLIEEGTQALSGAAASAAIAIAASAAIKIITPLAVKAFTRDLVSDLGGEDLGNALVSGANMYMGNNHVNGGGSLASYNKYIGFAKQQKEVIAENAKFERETKSPFDITSQYTFMGNLLKQVATMYTIKSPIFGGLSVASKMVSNSMIALLPSASAYDITTTVKPADDPEFSTNCPYLSSINAVGDAFCNPYIVTDMSTIDNDPITVVDDVETLGGLDANGDIDKTSHLAQYIVYCNQRKSSFGVADGNIASDFSVGDWNSDNATVNTVGGSLTSAIPVVGDLLDVASNTNQLLNTGWITGQSCVASDDTLEADGQVLGVSWSENKYYQRFLEDQRLLESINPEYESPVTAFLDEYYKENPIDDSYEGILAQKSGLTKDQVISLLDTIEYWDYIANYNPSERYAFGKPAINMEKELRFDNENQVAENPLVILINQAIYADIRNRNFAA